MQKDNKTLSVPDLTLVGHTENAEFALSISSAAPRIASGGQDTNVRLMSGAMTVDTCFPISSHSTGQLHSYDQTKTVAHAYGQTALLEDT